MDRLEIIALRGSMGLVFTGVEEKMRYRLFGGRAGGLVAFQSGLIGQINVKGGWL